MRFFISSITLRILMSGGHTKVHFPQNIHFCISSSSASTSPRRSDSPIFRTLKFVRLPALHVAVHPPHDMHVKNDDSYCNTNNSSRLSKLSKSICLDAGFKKLKSPIITIWLGNYLLPKPLTVHAQGYRLPTWDRYNSRQQKHLEAG